jgi:hypothetical protein
LSPTLVFVEAPAADPVFERPSPIIVPPLSRYAAIVQRPLFNDDRRRDPPPPPPAPPKPPPPPSADNYRLVGLILSSNLRMALVQRRQDGQVAHLHEGDMLDGWTVKTVAASGVQLTGSSGEVELTIPRAAQHLNSGIANSTVAGAHQSTE